MAPRSKLRSLKNSARRSLFRLVLNVGARGSRGHAMVFEELAKLGPRPGQILHRDDRHLLVDGGDHVIWCRADDELIGAGLVKHGHWQRDDFDAAVSLLASRGRLRGGIFVDVGANIGTQVIYALLNGHFSRVVAYEPEPENFVLLQRNIETNGLSPRATAIQSAVSNQGHGVVMALNAARPGMHAVSATESQTTIRVPSVRLVDGLAELGIPVSDTAIIWIDVEGHEYELFEGLAPYLDARVPIVFEYSSGSVSADERRNWCEALEKRYSGIASIERGVATEMPFAKAFSCAFTNLLVF